MTESESHIPRRSQFEERQAWVPDPAAAIRRDDYAERPYYIESEGERTPSTGKIIDDWPCSGDSKSNGDDRGFACTKVPLVDHRRQIDASNAFDPI